MSQKKSTLPPEIAAAAADVPEYEDRRAIPQPPRDYYVENDPILAEGDGRAILQAAPSTVTADEPIFGLESDDPAVEIAADADPIARLAAAMEKIASGKRPANSVDDSLMAKILLVLEKVAGGQAASTQAAADALSRGKDPSNFFAPDVSAFNPRGERDYPRPALRCKMHLPWEAERESLTREEIELLNLLDAGDYFITRNDESRIKINVRTRINANTQLPEVLLMNSETGFNNDYAWLMPSLRKMLREMLNQRSDTRALARGIRTMEEELDLIAEHGVHFERVLDLQRQQEVQA